MLISFLRWLASQLRSRNRRPAQHLLLLDEHYLRDIGLTRTDIAGCLSTPAHNDTLDFYMT
jgi:uncharacterized protein YjiS (DUF1127 family)